MGGTWAANMSVTSQQSSFPIRSTHNVHQVDAKLLHAEGAEVFPAGVSANVTTRNKYRDGSPLLLPS